MHGLERLSLSPGALRGPGHRRLLLARAQASGCGLKGPGSGREAGRGGANRVGVVWRGRAQVGGRGRGEVGVPKQEGASGWRGITCRRRALQGRGVACVEGVASGDRCHSGRRAAGTAPARPVSAGKKPVRGSGSEFPGLHRPSLRRSPLSVSISFLFLDELPGSACGTPAGDPRRHGFPLLRVDSVPSRPVLAPATDGGAGGK